MLSSLPGSFLIIFVLQFFSGFMSAQDLDFSEIFGENWKKAEQYERENHYWMEEMLRESQVGYETAIAIIFPELVRYSALRDKMETTLLKALYINLGDEYANFSIGRFQIKPSFAEKIRDEADIIKGRRSDIKFMQREDFASISDYRKSIVSDLEDPETQFRYVIAFISICDWKYKTGRMKEEEKLRFLATAYNYGIDKDTEQIMRIMDSKFFSASLLRTEKYCYADVSLFWYRNNRQRYVTKKNDMLSRSLLLNPGLHSLFLNK